MKQLISFPEVSVFLTENIDVEYQKFMSRLIPNTKFQLLGVRMPKLQTLCKQILKQDFRDFLNNYLPKTYEEVMLQGLVIAKSPLSLEEKLKYTQKFLSFIDNWGICDSFCAAFKDAKATPPLLWEFITQCIHSPFVYHQRFGVVMLLNYYVALPHLNTALPVIASASSQDYYVKMACAWAYSVYYISFPDQTLAFLQNNISDSFIFRKSIQKICESRRISEEKKAQLRTLLHS